MKKLIATISAAVVAAAGLLTFSACGSAEVTYALSEDGNSYIVSGVSGNKRALTEYEIPSTYDDGVNGVLPVTAVGEEAFSGCSGLLSISIPDSVTRIDDWAFAYTHLTSVSIPDSVTYIGYCAFVSCTALQEVTIPSSVTALGPYSFAYCYSLTTARVEASIDTLYIGTFMGFVSNSDTGIYTATDLEVIYLPSTLKYIHREAFSNNFLTDIYFAGDEEAWRDIEIFYATTTEDEEGETVEEIIYLTDEEKIEYFTTTGLTIHCADADLVYSNGEIQSTPVN